MQKITNYFILTLSVSIVVLLHTGIGKVPPVAKFFDPFQGFWQNAEKNPINLPPRLSLAALKDIVTVDFDKNLVPHIQANNEQDLYFAQGYITAFHRLWQMEFQTHGAAGRIAEIVGPAGVNFDKLQRRKGMVYAAKNALQQLEHDTVVYQMLQAYTAGINAYIASLTYKNLPIEYKLLDYKPEPWTLLKTALLSTQMADQLSGNDKSFENTFAFHALGEKKFQFLFPEYHGQASIIPPNTPWNFKPLPLKSTASPIPPTINYSNIAQNIPQNGSNNWAVAGKKTKHGYPYLANDPHLSLTLPALFYAIHLQAPTVHVAGLSLPGIPGVLIGFNESIAWGMTNSAWTVRDWYVIDFKDADKQEYYYDNLLLKSQAVLEEIKVRKHLSVYDTVIYTHLGPIVYDETFPNPDKPYNLAMRWIGHHPGKELYTSYLLNRAQNLEEFEQALAYYHVPAQNFAFASIHNDIGLKIAGEFPARWEGQGRFIMPGNTSAYAWQAFIPKAHQPKLINPVAGYVSSANERATDKAYPYYYFQFYEEYYRNRRIRNILGKLTKIDEKAMMQLQNDNYNLAAQENLPFLLQYLDITQLDDHQKEAYQTLLHWDYQHEAQQKAPTIFTAWQKTLNTKLWQAFHDQEAAISQPSFYYTMHVLKHHAHSPHLNLGNYQNLQELIMDTFKRAMQDLQNWQKVNQQSYQWGNYRETNIQHLAKIPSFGIHNLQVNGGEEIVNANNGSHGVAMRLVVALGKQPQAWLIYPGGQPGNPGNPYYTQFINAWCKGDYIKLSLLPPQATPPGHHIALLPPPTQAIAKD
jgi:penicillin amidase